MSKSSKFGIFFGLALSAALVIFLFRELDWASFWRSLESVRFEFLPIVVFLFLFQYLLRVLRWRLLLPRSAEGKRYPLAPLLESLSLGFLANLTLPLRAGEFLRAWTLSRQLPVSFSTGFASIVSERVFDVAALLVCIWAAGSQFTEVPPVVTIGVRALGLLTIAICVFMAAAYLFSDGMLRIARALLERLLGDRNPQVSEKILEILEDFSSGLRALSGPGELLLVIVLSFAVWLDFALMYQVTLWCFDLFPSLWTGLVVAVVIALAVAAPSSPGFVGTFQAGTLVALSTIYRYEKEFALAFSVFTHVIQAALTLAVGVFVLHRRGLTLSELKQIRDE